MPKTTAAVASTRMNARCTTCERKHESCYHQKIEKKKKLMSSVMIKHLHCKSPTFSSATRDAWEAYIQAASHDDDTMCILCNRVLTPSDATWIKDLKSSGRALDSIDRPVCSCIERCHLKCLLDKSSYVWIPRDSESYKKGVTEIGNLQLKCTRDPPGHGIVASPPAAIFQCVCPSGHSSDISMPIVSHIHSVGPTIDDTEAVFEVTHMD